MHIKSDRSVNTVDLYDGEVKIRSSVLGTHEILACSICQALPVLTAFVPLLRSTYQALVQENRQIRIALCMKVVHML